MEKKSFREWIEFAIDKEKEAVSFYAHMQTIAELQSQKALLEDLRAMEAGHARKLEALLAGAGVSIYPAQAVVEDMGIGGEQQEGKLDAQMTAQDILATAIKREEGAKQLYIRLAAQCENEEAKELLVGLSQEEARHKLGLEKIYEDQFMPEN